MLVTCIPLGLPNLILGSTLAICFQDTKRLLVSRRYLLTVQVVSETVKNEIDWWTRKCYKSFFQVGNPDLKLAAQYWSWIPINSFRSCLPLVNLVQLCNLGLLLVGLVKIITWLKSMSEFKRMPHKQAKI